jgi:poly(hydroxyalkanoate) depolymerase family esterase
VSRWSDAPDPPGTWLERGFRNAHGSRSYRLYVPATLGGRHVPLLLMLHGCSQTPEDFAAGTGMNLLAERTPLLVAYPAQHESANWHACWNWFDPAHQRREYGEPALLAGLTRHVIMDYPVDPARVYVAGMSAGGAMAAVMGMTYPELFAAVGVHSGLPYRAAEGLLSAWWAMRFGSSSRPLSPVAWRRRPVPLIAFHGDRDTRVDVINAHQLAAGWGWDLAQDATLEVRGAVPGGYGYTRSMYRRGTRLVMEKWIVHGLGHAWSGGSRAGSHTDPAGPAASEQIVRFFLAQAPRERLLAAS